jgi:hypothetical protein
MQGAEHISETKFVGGAYVRDIETPMGGGRRVSLPDNSEPSADVIFMDRSWPLQKIEANSHRDLVESMGNDGFMRGVAQAAIQLQLKQALETL